MRASLVRALALSALAAPCVSASLESEFERVRAALPALPYKEAAALLKEAAAQTGSPRPYGQDKIKHMVVLFVENRATDHIWGCMLGDKPGFDGIPSSSPEAAKCGTATYVCTGNYADTKFNGSQLPVKKAIADNYGVFNKMFTSVPGPSWPNHMFSQSATSCGISSNIMYNRCGGPFPQFPQMTIYDSLALANVSFGLYVNMTCGDKGDLPCSVVKPGWGTNTGNNQSTGLDPDVVMAGVARHSKNFFSHDKFYKQAAEGTLPAFSWISPPHEAADHPCMDIAKGERLVKDIYEAVRAGPGWDNTLLMLTYDDFGGFDDHVPMPKAPPDRSPCLVWNKEHGLPPTAPTNCGGKFDFTSVGHRGVAAIMSPWVAKGSIFQEPQKGPTNWSQYDHTSMLASAKSFFNLGGFLTERDAWAGTFDELLLDTPRADADMPMHLPDAPRPATPWAPWPGPPPPPKPAPKGMVWNCSADKSFPADKEGKSVRYKLGNLTGIDYTSGFTGLASCQSMCNGLYPAAGQAGCLALEYHAADKHCVLYSGTALSVEEFAADQTPTKDYTACMLAKDEYSWVDNMALEDSRRRLGAASGAVPQHCSQSAVPAGACEGAHVVTAKQRRNIELYSALTKTPMPDVETMGYVEADVWARARWNEYMAMLN